MAVPRAQAIGSETTFDARALRWRIGFVALATDNTAECDFARICPEDVGIYVSRVANENPTNHENLKKMLPRLGDAASLITPGEDPDVIAYGCTSASVVIGDEAVCQAIQAARPGVPVVTPSAAAVAGFQALGVRKVSVLTPYSLAVTDTMGAYFADQGLDIVSLHCFGLDDDRKMARITPAAIVEAAVEACHPEAEAMFLSCTALRAASVLDEIEHRLGKPAISSNQAMAWQALRLAGCEQSIGGYGRLLQ